MLRTLFFCGATLTYENIKNILALFDLNTLDFLGVKLLAMPKESSVEKRISINKDSIGLLDRAIIETSRA